MFQLNNRFCKIEMKLSDYYHSAKLLGVVCDVSGCELPRHCRFWSFEDEQISKNGVTT